MFFNFTREGFIDFVDVAFLHYGASFPPHFLNVVVEVKALGPSHTIKLLLGLARECSL